MVTSTSLYTNAATVNQANAQKAALPGGIKRYEEEAAKPKASGAANTQQDFLKLFTTQLQNQNPLEATTNMASQLGVIAGAITGDRMMSSAGLIGKSVITPGGNFALKTGESVQAVVDLPAGAEGLQVDIVNDADELVNRSTLGQQAAGSMYFSWNGLDQAGNAVPAGNYRFRVIGSSGGASMTPEVSLRKAIQGVSQDAAGNTMIEVQGGKTLKLADVARLGA